MHCLHVPTTYLDSSNAQDDDALPNRPTGSPDAWCATISVLERRPDVAGNWPVERSRVVRLGDDEPTDQARDAEVASLFRTLPHDLSEADRMILFALTSAGPASQRALARSLEMDRAYLSRRLRKLSERRLVMQSSGGWATAF